MTSGRAAREPARHAHPRSRWAPTSRASEGIFSKQPLELAIFCRSECSPRKSSLEKFSPRELLAKRTSLEEIRKARAELEAAWAYSWRREHLHASKQTNSACHLELARGSRRASLGGAKSAGKFAAIGRIAESFAAAAADWRHQSINHSIFVASPRLAERREAD